MHDSVDALLDQLRPEAWLGIMAGVAILTILGGYVYVIKPSLTQYRELLSSWSPEELERAAERSSTNQDAITRGQAALGVLHEELYGGPSGLPREQMESHIIGRLDHIASQHEVRLRTVTPGGADQILMFEELPYDVDVSGSYFALYEWLDAVERELRPMAVKSFEMHSVEDDVAMRLRLVSYRPRDGRS